MAKNDLLLHYVLSTDQMTLKCYEKDSSDVMYFFIYYSIEEGGGGGNWKILHITLTKQAVWPAANGFKLF